MWEDHGAGFVFEIDGLGTRVEQAPTRGIVVTRSDLERSEPPRIVNMDSP